MSDMTWTDVVERGKVNPSLTFARRKWGQKGKFVWVEPASTITAPTGDEYPVCVSVYFKDFDGVVKPYWPSMDGMTEADDWYVGVSGQSAG